LKPKLTRLSKPDPGLRKTILEINNIGKVFRVNGTFLAVLAGIDFSVKKGELICILGRSGCGKSTLLKLFAGFLTPSSGEILLNGKPVSAPGTDRCVIFQEDTLFPWLTVQENIAFGLKGRTKNKKGIQEEVDRFLALVGLTDFRDYLPREISGGMKQRVAMARVLILKPQILLMDEPFAALDAQTREEMQNLLLSLWEKLSHTIIFVTHDVNEASTLSDRILVMGSNPGRIRQDIHVGLARPRKMEERSFVFFSRKLHQHLRD
jgi:NitT/TauT family transport system ATP-binding protein